MSRHVPKIIWDYLDKEERLQVEDFIEKSKISPLFLEEDVSGMSPISFIVTETGITTLVTISNGKEKQAIFSRERTENL